MYQIWDIYMQTSIQIQQRDSWVEKIGWLRSGMIYHLGASLKEQHTAGLLICHGI